MHMLVCAFQFLIIRRALPGDKSVKHKLKQKPSFYVQNIFGRYLQIHGLNLHEDAMLHDIVIISDNLIIIKVVNDYFCHMRF